MFCNPCFSTCWHRGLSGCFKEGKPSGLHPGSRVRLQWAPSGVCSEVWFQALLNVGLHCDLRKFHQLPIQMVRSCLQICIYELSRKIWRSDHRGRCHLIGR